MSAQNPLSKPFQMAGAGAVFGLTAAALLGILIWAGAVLQSAGPNIPAVHLDSKSGTLILGRWAETRNHSFGIEPTSSGRALLLQEVSIQADDMPVLSYSLEVPGALEAAFVWESAEQLGSIHEVILPTDGHAVRLSTDPAWDGTIVRVGMLLRPAPGMTAGEAGRAGVAHASLIVEPSGLQNRTQDLTTRWWAFRGWTGTSINHLGRSWLPALLVLWTIVGAVIAAASCRPARGRAAALAIAFGLGAGWLVLHGLWLRQLHLQSTETRQRFDADSFEASLARGHDGELVAFVRQISNVMGRSATGGRIALVSEERFFGERARYLLLPRTATHFRNVGSLRNAAGRLAPGDAVVADQPLAEAVATALRQKDIEFSEALNTPEGVMYLIADRNT